MTKILLNVSKIFTVLIIIFSFAIFPAIVKASAESDLEAIQKQLEDIRKRKGGIQNEINNENAKQNEYARELYRLKNEIDLLGAQIEEKELTVQELQLKIQILEKDIRDAIAKIDDAEGEIDSLQDQTDKRLIDMYLSQKTFSDLDLFFSSHGTDIIKIDLYQTSLQAETNSLLEELGKKKVELARRKTKMEEDKIQIEKDEAQISEEKIALERDKASIDQQRDIYYRKRNESLAKIDDSKDALGLLTTEEQQALGEQRRLEQIVFDRINSIPSGSYVAKGTIIGQQGCTGYCTGPHLHFAVKVNGGYQNPCSVLPSGYLSGCGISGSSMDFPQRGSYVLTSGYGWRWGSFHYGIDVANYNASAPIYAAHSGYMYSGFEPCSSTNPLCKNGGANYRIICQNQYNCNAGFKTMYWHLRN